jgi:Uma2 family endonuclease
MAAPIYWTAEQVRALPEDGKRYETVHGELLVTPAPRAWHQEIIGRLLVSLRAYTKREGVGHVFASPADISWGEDTLVQPDLFVVPLADARTMDWRVMQSLLLAIEVLSPSSARADRLAKRRLYQEVGVGAYWVVDPDQRAVEVWTPAAAFPTVEHARVTWWPSGAAEPFVVELDQLLRPL